MSLYKVMESIDIYYKSDRRWSMSLEKWMHLPNVLGKGKLSVAIGTKSERIKQYFQILTVVTEHRKIL